MKFDMKKILFLFFWLVVFRGLVWANPFEVLGGLGEDDWKKLEFELAPKNSNGQTACAMNQSCDLQRSISFVINNLGKEIEAGYIYEEAYSSFAASNYIFSDTLTCEEYKNDYLNFLPDSFVCQQNINDDPKLFLKIDNDFKSFDLSLKGGVNNNDLQNYRSPPNNYLWLRMKVKDGYKYIPSSEGNRPRIVANHIDPEAQEITDFKFFYHEKDGSGEWKKSFDQGSESSDEIKIEDNHFPNSDFSQEGKSSDPNWKLKNSESLDSDDELLRNGTFKVAFSVEFKNENDYSITFKNIQIPFVVRQKHGFTLPLSKYEIKVDDDSSFWINDANDPKQEWEKEDKIKNYSNKSQCEGKKYFWNKDEQQCSFVFNCGGKINCDRDIEYIVKVDSLAVDANANKKIKIQLYFVQESFWGENYQFNEPTIKASGTYEYEEDGTTQNKEFLFDYEIPKIILNNKPFNQFPSGQEEWWQAVGGGVYVKNLINNTPLQTDKDKNDDPNLSLVTNLYLKNQDNKKFNAFSNCRYTVYNSLVTKNSIQYKNSCSPFLNTSLLKYYLPNKTVGPFGGFIMYGNNNPDDIYKNEEINSKKYTNQLSERELTCLASDSVCDFDHGEKIDDDQFSLKLEEPLDVGTYQYYFNLAKSKHQDFYDLLSRSSNTYNSSSGVPQGNDVGSTTTGCKFVEFPLIDDSSKKQNNLLCYFDNVVIDGSNPWVVNADYPITIFADSLTIKGNGSDDTIPIKVEGESYLGFFIKNNIIIDENVGSVNRQSDGCLEKGYPAFFAGSRNNGTGVEDNVCYSKDFFTDEEEHLNGVFFTDGELIIESDGNLSSIDRKLNLKGIYIAKGDVDIKRSYGNDAGKNIKHLNPIVRFIFNPDLNLTAPEWLKKSRKIYQEVN